MEGKYMEINFKFQVMYAWSSVQAVIDQSKLEDRINRFIDLKKTKMVIIATKETGWNIFSPFSQVKLLTWFLLLMQGEVAVRVL